MKLKIKLLKFLAGRPIAILNAETANRINVHIGERIELSRFAGSIISVVDISKDGLIGVDEIAVSEEIIRALNLREGEGAEVGLAEKPESTILIRKKMDGKILEKGEIFSIIRDIVDNALTEAEIAYFVSAVYKNGMNKKETEDLINAMVSTGVRLHFSGKVVDKHSIGGLGANRTTPIIVSICSAAGLVMPKTSSRAITSAAGTADVIESIARVELSAEEIKKIVEKTGACMAWGGSLGLSPADDKLIQIERLLSLDPEAQLLASVLSKKIAVGSRYVLIDIPYGKSAKVDLKKGLLLKKKFESLGKKFGLKLRCALTKGDEPIGNGIGPLMEIRDVLRVLKRENSPRDLEEKSLFLTSKIFELCNLAKKGKGKILARKILDSGRAFSKFKQIISAQSGKTPEIKDIEPRLGKFTKSIIAHRTSRIKEINSKKLSLIARIAGSPMDKGAGIYFYYHLGEIVRPGDKILTIYSESHARLSSAIALCEKIKPVLF